MSDHNNNFNESYGEIKLRIEKRFPSFDPEDVRDAIGTAILGIFLRRNDEVINNLESYLMNATRFRLMGEAKRKKENKAKERSVTQAIYDSENPKVEIDPWDRAYYTEFIRENIHRLTDRQQEVILLTLENKSIKEIAAKLKVSRNTVKKHKDNAKKILYSIFKSKEADFFTQ
ncbi:sigma-70 family RNA polymerase sigma factor [Chitinophaga sp. CC14]|uniref:sigma-70 family RNA polymerase sigma factor n=1 Tax=Chitinophaga TaxID=79328 RepID=UPI000DB9F6F7|nr:sigma-70 family RNA polymerase sigma factor [Chitinophaga ginsengisegetis]MDR6567500.1 RNA polymerase sigma factor (sigma-70 family) [Chitinophaga ginsengisegetis]MDR6647231.1 RNA polymerase sigma factor (sigma-70 family) [Chitinophaga ginsengisegetis]MDR6653580.1 RNA polymerase sigma factor (sigma-70 family) [Chitinophaga ginsengisegetis]